MIMFGLFNRKRRKMYDEMFGRTGKPALRVITKYSDIKEDYSDFEKFLDPDRKNEDVKDVNENYDFIRSNAEYQRWAEYFYVHKFYNKEMEKVFYPSMSKRFYADRTQHIITDGKDVTEALWMEFFKNKRFDTAETKVENYSVICGSMGLELRLAWKRFLVLVSAKMNEDIQATSLEEVRSKPINEQTSVSLRTKDLENADPEMLVFAKVWQDLCPTSVINVDPATDTPQKWRQRDDALRKTYLILGEYGDMSKKDKIQIYSRFCKGIVGD